MTLNWTSQQEIIVKIENRYIPILVRYIRSYFRAGLVLYREGRLNELENQFYDPALMEIIQNMYRTSGVSMARFVYKNMPTVRQLEKKSGQMGISARWLAAVKGFLNQFAMVFVSDILGTLKEDMIKIFEKAAQEGWGYERTARELMNEGLPLRRAKVIARTEAHRGAMVGSMQGADSLPYEVQKEWISATDSRVRRRPKDRFDHVKLNGQIKELNEPFQNEEQIMFPGDPKASAANTIQCFLPDQLTMVNKDIIKHSIKSFYYGQVVTIVAANGNRFTCTPNHPIMTSRGFVPAGQICEGDYILNSRFINDSVCPKLNINDIPSTFEQIHNSLSDRCHIIRDAGTIVNLYGRIPNGNIDIIYAKRVLRGSRNSIFRKFVDNVLFQYPNLRQAFRFGFSRLFENISEIFSRLVSGSFMCFTGKPNPFFLTSLRHPAIHSFTPIPNFNTGFFNSSFDNTPINVEHRGKTFNADAFLMEFNDFSNRDIFTPVQSNFFHDYSGYVYTFETDYQIYDINGFVASNCRCVTGYIPKRDARGRLIMKNT